MAMVPDMSVNHSQSSDLENVRSKHCAQKVLQPHVIQESSVSQLRYEPRLRHCRIRCHIYLSIEKVRSNQIIWCHTRPYRHMRWIMFQLLCETGIQLWPGHHISVAHCDRWHICHWKEPLSGIRHLRMCPAEHGMIHSANPCRHPTVHSRKLGDMASHSSLSSCVLALLTVAHQALTIVSVSTSLGNVQWKRQPLHMLPSALFSPTPRPVFNTSKSERSFFPIQHCRPSWWCLIKPFPERSHHLGHGLPRVLSLMHSQTCHQELLDKLLVSAIRKTTWEMGCPVCCLSCTHKLATKSSSIE